MGIDLIVLGIDGADPRYLEEAMEKYELPGWKKLERESFYTELPSTVPAITLPAWPCMFSGYNPGRFEAYHLVMSDFENWGSEVVDSSYFRGYHFWDRIDAELGIHFVPGTSPPYPIKGWMRSGSLRKNLEFYPPELGDELEEKMELEKEGSHGKITSSAKIESEKRNFRKERKVSQHIYNKDPDAFVSVFQLVDRAGHFAEKKENILDTYRYIDDLIDEFMEKAEQREANLIMVSDHGFQLATTKFNIITFLKEKGFLEFQQGSGETLAYRLAKPLLDTRLKKYLKYIHDLYSSYSGNNLIGREVGALGSVSKDSRIVPYFAEGREAGLKVHTEDMPNGLVPEGEKEEIISEVINELEGLEDDQGEVMENVWRGEELYPGAEKKPDIVIQTREGMVVSTEPSSAIFDKTRSFTHDETGVMFARGPDIDEDADEEMDIKDVAPLIYAMMNEPIPEDIDGQLPAELVPQLEPEYQNYANEIENIEV